MEISLKKANDLQRAVLAAAGKIDPAATVSVSPFAQGDAGAVVQTAVTDGEARFMTQLGDAFDLMDAGYEIRRLLGDKNATSGVNTLLCERAWVEAQEKRLSAVLLAVLDSTDQYPSEDAIGRLARAQNPLTTQTYYDSARIHVSILTERHIAKMQGDLASLRARKSDLTDQIAGRNLNTKITLPDSTVELLRKHNLIAF
jgi:hypothetical protein